MSAFTPPPPGSEPSLGDPEVQRIMRGFGGQLTQLPTTPTRWYLRDVETALRMANAGDLSRAAQLMAATRSDGVLSGVLSTRTGGLVRLPKVYRGNVDMANELREGGLSGRSIYDEMCPAAELAALAADGELLGIGVAQLIPVKGRPHPVLCRLDPQYLYYRWAENRWYYRSVVGQLPITPGDGKWVLHIPGGRVNPWLSGLWRAVGKAWIRKDHANLHRDNWEAKLANPARVAVAPTGAAEEQTQKWFRAVLAWGVNTVFGVKPGYDVKLLESNGQGAESFEKTIAAQDREMTIAVAGQTVTTDGGAGFQNSDVHRTIRADLIKSTADSLAHTVNTQILPQWVATTYGEAALADSVTMSWDVTPPKDRAAEASAKVQAAAAIKQLTEALDGHSLELDVAELASQFEIPIAPKAAGKPSLQLVQGGAS